MKPFYHLKEKFLSSRKAIERFPLPMIFSIISTGFFILSIQRNEGIKNNAKLGFFFLFATALYLNIKLFLEGIIFSKKDKFSFKNVRLLKASSYLLSLPAIFGMYLNIFYLNKEFKYNSLYIYIGCMAFLIISIFFISKLNYFEDFIPYVLNVNFQLVASIIYSMTIGIGLLIFFVSLNKLFDLNMDYKHLLSLELIVFIPLNLGFFLSDFPIIQKSFNDYEVSKEINILVNNIFIPLIYLYTLILYAYFFKIVFTMTLPKGIIINLVLWFSIFTTFVIFISAKTRGKIGQSFKKIQPVLSLPLILFMFYSIYLRINQYGFTINRYLVVALGFFSLLSMLYYIFVKNSSNMTIIVLFSIIVLISSIGPVSAYNISAISQNKRLKNILTKNQMLVGGKIVANNNISDDDKKEIISIVNYLNDYFEPKDIDLLRNYDSNFERTFGFNENIEAYDNSYEVAKISDDEAIDTTGYDSFIAKEFYNGEIIYDDNNIKIYGENNSIIITKKTKGSEVSKEIYLNDIAKKYLALKKDNSIINQNDLAYKGSIDGLNYKIIFKELSFTKEDNKIEILNVSFYFLMERVN